jgi:predicted transcriptional regulator
MAPPKRGTPIQVRIPDSDLWRLDRLALTRGTTRVELVRQAIADYLTAHA